MCFSYPLGSTFFLSRFRKGAGEYIFKLVLDGETLSKYSRRAFFFYIVD